VLNARARWRGVARHEISAGSVAPGKSVKQ
jgi:hypothetical protein